ncbi:integrase [Streptomyces sp. NPDC057623]|uniref:integrase n=1 Tax=Streptomyces sp. NPDC057623 TaxID=3346187 RepID=UPI0036C5EBC3
MSTALELDPYRLPLPNPTTAVVPAHLVVAQHAHLNARYADQVWPLAPLIENPSARRYSVYWQKCPASLREEIRLVAWTMINGQLRPTFLKERAGRLRARLAGESTGDSLGFWMALGAWLETRDIHTLADCDSGVLHEYGLRMRDSGNSRDHVQKILGSLTRLWAFDQLSARPAGIGRPPWDELGADDYLPQASSAAGENSTEPLVEQTMGPLLVWAMRMIDDLADDILAAWSETKRISDLAERNRYTATASGKAALDDFLAAAITGQAPVPASSTQGKPAFARTYVMGLTGAAAGQVDRLNSRHRLTQAAAERPGPCPLDVPVTGLIAGAPWREALDFNETPTLMRHLGTAAFIVCAFLTGMRPEELLGMRSGCCPDPEPDEEGKIGRHLIRSYEYKSATDDDGNHLSAGIERDVPWVAITPVVNAIRVLERIVPAGRLLFDQRIHDIRASRAGTGSLKLSAMRKRIEDFVSWVNTEAATQGLPHEVIPPDPHGKIGTSRFRRSLAWHIARRPGGLVALAIQYGHMRTALDTEVSGGYGSRSRNGIHDLVNMETVLATAETAADLREQFDSGGGISGPAAREALHAALRTPLFEGQEVKADYARKYLARDGAVLYDNPQALLICRFKRDRALCQRDGIKDTPSLDGCVRGCGNIVRTDAHAAELRIRADIHDKRAVHTPEPVSARLRAKAAQDRADADAHDQNRITRQEAAS